MTNKSKFVSETTFYVFLGKIFNIIRPDDHYHSAHEVETFLNREAFIKLKYMYLHFIFLL